MIKPQIHTIRKAEPAPELLVTKTVEWMDARFEQQLDAIAEMLSARQPEPTLTPAMACQVLQVSGPTLGKLRAAGMPHLRLGDDLYRYERAAILEWLRARSAVAP